MVPARTDRVRGGWALLRRDCRAQIAPKPDETRHMPSPLAGNRGIRRTQRGPNRNDVGYRGSLLIGARGLG